MRVILVLKKEADDLLQMKIEGNINSFVKENYKDKYRKEIQDIFKSAFIHKNKAGDTIYFWNDIDYWTNADFKITIIHKSILELFVKDYYYVVLCKDNSFEKHGEWDDNSFNVHIEKQIVVKIDNQGFATAWANS